MTLPEIVAIIMWVGITLYAVLAGADFGAGLWDLLAGGSRRGARPRALIDIAIGPVWEVNHVWLVFCLVILWTAFPTVFSSIMLTLYIPLGLAAIGIVLRGSGFAYRHVTTSFAARRLFGAVFAISSIITPFFLGTVLGAIAGGRVPLGGEVGDPVASWWNAPGIYAGVLAVVACGYLAAVYLVTDARRHDDNILVAYFRVRAMVAGSVAGVVAVGGLVVARDDIPELFSGLTGTAAPLVVVSAMCGVATLVLLWNNIVRWTRELAVVAVASIVWAWGLAQQPWMLPDQITVADAAASPATLWALMVAVGVAGIVIVPALTLLWRLDQTNVLETDDIEHEARANRG